MNRVIYHHSQLADLPDGARIDYISYCSPANKNGIHFIKIYDGWYLKRADKTISPHKFEDKDFADDGSFGHELLVVL